MSGWMSVFFEAVVVTLRVVTLVASVLTRLATWLCECNVVFIFAVLRWHVHTSLKGGEHFVVVSFFCMSVIQIFA